MEGGGGGGGGVESYQLLQNWYSSGCSARRVAIEDLDWLARFRYTVTRQV